MLQREAAALQREEYARSVEADLRSVTKQLDDITSKERRMRADPVAYIRSIAPDLDLRQLSYAAWYAADGKEPPADIRLQQQVAATRYELEDLRTQTVGQSTRQAEAAAENARQQQALNMFANEVRTIVVDPAAKYQHVTKLAKKSADKAVERAIEKARQIAIRDNRVPTAAEVVAAIDMDLGELAEAMGLAAEQTAPPPPVAASAPQASTQSPTTLRNNHSGVQPSRTDADPFSEDALRRLAYAEVGVDYDDPNVRRLYED